MYTVLLYLRVKYTKFAMPVISKPANITVHVIELSKWFCIYFNLYISQIRIYILCNNIPK